MRTKLFTALLLLIVLPGYYTRALAVPPQIFFKVTMLPPYSAYLSDYSNSYMVTITNQGATAADIYLQARLSNDQGQYAQTRSNVYSLPIHVEVRQTVTLMGNQVDPYLFSAAKLDNHFTNSTLGNINRDGQLPEGVYNFCITPYYFEAGRAAYLPVTLNPPGGNCAIFVISTAKPPILTTPVNDQAIAANGANAVNISWIRPTGVTGRASLSYTLYIVKLNPGENPSQVMTNVADYGAGYFYKVTGLLQNTYQLNSTLPYQLEPGSRYAVMVQAVDNSRTLAIENNGRSVVNSFIYGIAATTQSAKTSVVSGNLPVKVSGIDDNTPSGSPFPNYNPVVVRGKIMTGLQFMGKDYPLANKQVHLYKIYFAYFNGAGATMVAGPGVQVMSTADGLDGGITKQQADAINASQVEEIGTTTTDAFGNFNFSVLPKDTATMLGGAVISGEIQPDAPNAAFKKLGIQQPPGHFGKTVNGVDQNGNPTSFVVPNFDVGSPCTIYARAFIQIDNQYYDCPYTVNVSDSNLVAFDPSLKTAQDQQFPVYNGINDLGTLSAMILNDNVKVKVNLLSNQCFDNPGDHSNIHIYILYDKNLTPDVNQLPQPFQDALKNPKPLPYSLAKNQDFGIFGEITTNKDGFGSIPLLGNAVTGSSDLFGSSPYYIYAETDDASALNYRNLGKMPRGMFSDNSVANGYWIGQVYNAPPYSYEYDLNMEALPSGIWGHVLRGDNGHAAAGAVASIQPFNNIDPSLVLQSAPTDSTGRYEFAGFAEGKNSSSWQLSGHEEHFIDASSVLKGSYTCGQKYPNGYDLTLGLYSKVSGSVVDENGQGVDCLIALKDGTNATTDLIPNANLTTTAAFAIEAPGGMQIFYVYPKNQAFGPDSVQVAIQSSGSQQLSPFVVKKRKHHLQIVVQEYQAAKNTAGSNTTVAKNGPSVEGEEDAPVVIPNARITIMETGQPGFTDNNGIAVFAFAGSDNMKLTLKIKGPDNEDYIATMVSVYSHIADEQETITIGLKKGVTLSGRVVMAGLVQQVATSQPDGGTISPGGVAGATVRWDNSNADNPLEAVTDAQGYYVLHGVPGGYSLSFAAMKEGYTGSKKLVALSKTGAHADFTLSKYSAMDLSKLLGFDIEVSSFDAKTMLMSGYIINIPGNAYFAASAATKIPFHDIKVKAGSSTNDKGQPYPVPETLPMATGINSLLVTTNYDAQTAPLILEKLEVQLKDPVNGIRIQQINKTLIVGGTGEQTGKRQAAPAATTGGLLAMASISGSSFNISGLSFGDAIYLRSSKQAAAPDDITTLTADGSSPFLKNGIYLSDGQGADFAYQLYGFTMQADHNGSYLLNNSCTIAGKIKAAFMSDKSHSDSVTIPHNAYRAGNGAMTSISSKAAFSFALQQWTVQAAGCSIDANGGFIIPSGYVDMKGTQTSFTQLKVLHNFTSKLEELADGKFELNKLNLVDIASLQLNGKGVFSFDDTANHWIIYVQQPGGGQAAGTITGLQGLPPLAASSIYLQSDLGSHYQLNNALVKLDNGLASVDLSYIEVNPISKTINVRGSFDFGLPGFQYEHNLSLSYTQKGRSLQADTLRGTNINGVDLFFVINNTSLKAGKLVSPGTLSESGKYTLNVTLSHDASGNSSITDAWQYGSQATHNHLMIDKGTGKKYIDIQSGSMAVVNGQWTNYQFAGNLVGYDQVHGNNLAFTIRGDVSLNDNQQLSVDDAGSFAGMKMVFDFNKGTFTGSMSIPQQTIAGFSFSGDCFINMDKNGWYFGLGGDVNLQQAPIPFFSGGGIALLIGNYGVSLNAPQINGLFSSHTDYQSIPDLSINNEHINYSLKGFLMAVKVQKNFVHLDENLWVVNVSADATLFGDMFFSTHFGNNLVFGIGALLGAHASINAGISEGVACQAVKIAADVVVAAKGQFSTSGNWEVDISAGANLSGTMEVGTGVCESDCSNSLCATTSFCGSVGFSAEGAVSNTGIKGPSIHLHANGGTCGSGSPKANQ